MGSSPLAWTGPVTWSMEKLRCHCRQPKSKTSAPSTETAAIAAALGALFYFGAYGFWSLLAVALLQAAALGPLAPLGDSLVPPGGAAPPNLTGDGERPGFNYG